MRYFCIATGPSLREEDVLYCQGKGKVYVVKETYHIAPWADALYAADHDWWERLNGVPEFKGKKWTCDEKTAKKYDLNYIPYRVDSPWSNDPSYVATGGHSGFQTMNLAALHGATEIILLGYDMGYSGSSKHWWTGKYKREIRGSDYNDWIKRFHAATKHIKIPIYNASRFSYLTCFPKVALEDVR